MSCVKTGTPTHLLCHTIDVERLAATVGVAGGVTNAYVAHLSDVAARVQPLSGAEAMIAGRDATRKTMRIFVSGTVDIIPSDRILFEGDIFDISEVKDNQSASVLKSIICEEVE